MQHFLFIVSYRNFNIQNNLNAALCNTSTVSKKRNSSAIIIRTILNTYSSVIRTPSSLTTLKGSFLYYNSFLWNGNDQKNENFTECFMLAVELCHTELMKYPLHKGSSYVIHFILGLGPRTPLISIGAGTVPTKLGFEVEWNNPLELHESGGTFLVLRRRSNAVYF